MKLLAVLLAGVVAATLAPAAATAEVSSRTGPPERARTPEKIEDRYIVVFEDSVARPSAATEGLERAVGFEARFTYADAVEGFAARLSRGQVRSLEHDPRVDFVVADRKVHAAESVALTAGETAPTGVRRIGAATTSTTREASSVNVAVIDSGIDLSHPDLNAAHGVNCMGSGPAQDDNGHGTHVAGTIAAENNGAGVVGVAPGTQLYAVKVLDASGNGTVSSVICGINWVTSTTTDSDPSNDVAVANMSLGGIGNPVASCASTSDAEHLAICRSTSAGVAYVVAAGNSGWDFDYATNPDTPAAFPEVLTVTAAADGDGAPGGSKQPACDPDAADDGYSSFSNFALTGAGASHTIAAPGHCIRSTVPGGGYATYSGTSMAAPHVAGAVALCLDEAGVAGPCSGMTPGQIIDKIRSDAQARPASYGFIGDPAHPVDIPNYGRAYFGHLAWAGLAEIDVEPTDPPDILETVDAAPDSVTIVKGTRRSGGVGRLANLDSSYFAVNSTTGSAPRSRWFGSFSGVPNSLADLEVAYAGKASRRCAQTISIYRWGSSSWGEVATSTAGSSPTLVERPVAGKLARFVSGSSGPGELRVRVACEGERSFFTSADSLTISYGIP